MLRPSNTSDTRLRGLAHDLLGLGFPQGSGVGMLVGTGCCRVRENYEKMHQTFEYIYIYIIIFLIYIHNP